MKKILVLIPTLNAEKYLNKLLFMLKKQTFKVDILIVDSSSDDKTVEICRKNDVKVEIISRTDFSHSKTRNIVLNYKQYDYYLFMTQDAIPYNEFLVENLVKGFKIDKDIVATYARQIAYSNDLEKIYREFNYPKKSQIKLFEDIKVLGIKACLISDSCAMYDAKFFSEVGGFNEQIYINEDVELGYKILKKGKKIYYNSKALVYHQNQFSFFSLIKRYYLMGKFYKTFDCNKKIGNNGIDYMKFGTKYLFESKKLYLLPKFIFINGLKYLSFKIGFIYG